MFKKIVAVAFYYLLAFTAVLSAASPTTMVVVNQGDGTASFVNLESFEVEETIELGNGPHEATASPDGKRVYVSMYGRQVANDEVAVIDPAKRAVVTRFDLAPSERPHGIVTRGDHIFITLERDGAVAKMNRDGEIVWRGRTTGELGHMLAVSADGKRIYTGNMKTNDVSILEAGGDEPVAVVPVGKGPEGIALSPDGSELWVAHRMSGGLSVIDTAKAEVVATPGEGVFSARLTFTPDGRKVVAYDMSSRNVVVFDRASRTELGRYRPDEGIPVTGLAKDARHIYVIRYQPDAIFELDLETMEPGRTVETGSMPDGLALAN